MELFYQFMAIFNNFTPTSSHLHPLRPSSFKETKCFFPAHAERFSIVGSLRDRNVAYPASEHKARISSPVSVWQCDIIILRGSPGPFSLYVHTGGMESYLFYFTTYKYL